MKYEIDWELKISTFNDVPHVVIAVDETQYDVYFAPSAIASCLKRTFLKDFFMKFYNRKTGLRKRSRKHTSIMQNIYRDNYSYIRKEAPKLLLKHLL